MIGKSSGYRTEGVSNFKNMLIQVSNFKNRAALLPLLDLHKDQMRSKFYLSFYGFCGTCIYTSTNCSSYLFHLDHI